MCTIDPLYCWYYDYENWWRKHRLLLYIAQETDNRDGIYRFIWRLIVGSTIYSKNKTWKKFLNIKWQSGLSEEEITNQVNRVVNKIKELK